MNSPIRPTHRNPKLALERLKANRMSPWRWWIWQTSLTCRSWFRRATKWLWDITLSRWLYLKRTHSSAAGEVATMRFIASRTTIPVPRVYGSWKWLGAEYMLMRRAPGITLRQAWPSLLDEQKCVVIDQLAAYVRQLRNLPTPYGPAVCSVIGGPFLDCRLSDRDVSGPFLDEEHMNRQLRHGHPIDKFPPVAEAHSQTHPIVFTHGDLAMRNIMVQGDTVTAVLDWESAGWFPAHWEHCKTVFADMEWEWRDWIPKIVTTYDSELEADKYLRQTTVIPRIRAEPVLSYVPLASSD